MNILTPLEIKILQKVFNKIEGSCFLEDYSLQKHEVSKFNRIRKRVKEGYPADYIFKKIDFYGREFFINKHTLIPRPETEHWIKDIIQKKLISPDYTVIDIGSGSGVIGITLACLGYETILTDIDHRTIRVVKKNILLHKVGNKTRVFKSDLLINKSLRGNIFSKKNYVFIANLPYVPQTDVSKRKENNVYYEPKHAIFAGKDGLLEIRRLFEQIKRFNFRPAYLICELDPRNIHTAATIATQIFNPKSMIINKDFNNFDRCLIVKMDK